MSCSRWIRQAHRWLSMAFTAGVIANIIAIAILDQSKHEQPDFWVYLLALIPLVLLLLSGLYLFVLPFAARLRSPRLTGRSA